jgi:hypothetical protein
VRRRDLKPKTSRAPAPAKIPDVAAPGAPGVEAFTAAPPRRLTPAQAQARLEAILARAMRSSDPPGELQRAAADPALPPALRRALLRADGDGVRLAALLISKLRFERLIRASAEAEQQFADDPEAFAQTFRRYHESIPPADFFPPREAQRFRRFLAEEQAAASEPASEGAQEREQGKPLSRR